MKHVNILYGQNAELLNVTRMVSYIHSNYSEVRG
jgi:hypothetical protein